MNLITAGNMPARIYNPDFKGTAFPQWIYSVTTSELGVIARPGVDMSPILQEAVNKVAAEGGMSITISPGVYELQTLLDIPPDMTVIFSPGAIIKPIGSSGEIFFNYNPIVADAGQQIFDVSEIDTDIVNGVDGWIKAPFLFLEWFGGKGDDSTDCTKAMWFCIYLAARINSTAEIRVGSGVYQMDNIQLRNRVAIVGMGNRSILKQRNNADQDFITLISPSVEMTRLANVFVHGNKHGQPNSTWRAIYYNNAGGSFSFYDQVHVIENIIVYIPPGSGVVMGSGVREARVRNVYVTGAGRYGFDLTDTDGFYESCTAAQSGLAGFNCNNPNSRYVNCKSFGSGNSQTVGNEMGFMIRGQRMSFTSCEAQDNNTAGFYLFGARAITMSSCIAEANGRRLPSYGWEFDEAQWCVISGGIADDRQATPTQVGGVWMKNTNAIRNRIEVITRNNYPGRSYPLCVYDLSSGTDNSFTTNGDANNSVNMLADNDFNALMVINLHPHQHSLYRYDVSHTGTGYFALRIPDFGGSPSSGNVTYKNKKVAVSINNITQASVTIDIDGLTFPDWVPPSTTRSFFLEVAYRSNSSLSNRWVVTQFYYLDEA